MANSNLPALGRFSSQMLTYLGAQRTVQTTSNGSYNTFKYATEPLTYPSPGSQKMANLGLGVVGAVSGGLFDRVKGYFLSRGASQTYADTMTLLTIDIAFILDITPISLIEKVEKEGKVLFTDEMLSSFNVLRDPSHQVAQSSDISNRDSFKANEIRA